MSWILLVKQRGRKTKLLHKNFWWILRLFKVFIYCTHTNIRDWNSRTENFNSDARTTTVTLLQSFSNHVDWQLKYTLRFLGVYAHCRRSCMYSQTDDTDIIKVQRIVNSKIHFEKRTKKYKERFKKR